MAHHLQVRRWYIALSIPPPKRPLTDDLPSHLQVVVENRPPPRQQPTTPLNLLRERPEYVFCPAKNAVVETKCDSKDSDKTWLAVFGVCLICPCVACFPLKGCCGEGMLQDWDHHCGGCGKQLTHRPYNRENQILAPDHDSAANPAPGWQGGPLGQEMQYFPPQQGRPQYAPQQQTPVYTQ